MITLYDAQHLQPGNVLVDNMGRRWKVNGQVKVWKRDPSRVRVPIKHGLHEYGYVHEGNLNWVSLAK